MEGLPTPSMAPHLLGPSCEPATAHKMVPPWRRRHASAAADPPAEAADDRVLEEIHEALMTGQPDKKPKQQHPTPMQPCPPAYPPPTALLRADGHLRAEPLASPPVPPLRQHGANAADAAYGLMALRFGVASKNQHRGGRLLTELPCEMAGCGRLRESAACRFCAVHCVRQEQEPCRVHWDFPQRCQVRTTFCMAKRPSNAQCVYCRAHCADPECGYHQQPPKQSSNRTRGLRSATRWQERQSAS